MKFKAFFLLTLIVVRFAGAPESALAQRSWEDSQHLVSTLFDSGRLLDAEQAGRQALSQAESVYGADHVNVAVSANDLAGVLSAIGKQSEAEALYKRALAVREKATGSKSVQVGLTLNNLGFLYLNSGRYTEAKQSLEQSVDILRAAVGAEHPSYATALSNLGELHFREGRVADAEVAFKEVLKIRSKTLGTANPLLAVALNNLAFLYSDRGRFDEAIPLYRRALPIVEKSGGADHPDVATTLHNLAEALFESGDAKSAEPFLVRAIAIRGQRGESAPELLVSLNTLGELYAFQRRYDQAVPVLLRVIRALETSDDASSEQLIGPLSTLGSIYSEQRALDSANATFGRAITIAETKKLSAETVASLLGNRASVRRAAKDYPGAVADLKQVVSRQRSDSNGSKEAQAAALLMLGTTLVDAGLLPEARATLEEAIKLAESTLGEESLDVARFHHAYGDLCLKEGRLPEAITSFRKDVKLTEAALGSDSPELGVPLLALGSALQLSAAASEELAARTAATNEAKAVFARALKLTEHNIGATNPLVIDIKAKIKELQVK